MNEPLLIFGHPNGWNETFMSEGVIRGVTTVAAVSGGTPLDPAEQSRDRKVIAVESHVEAGNSGGPAFDSQGKVAGVVDKGAVNTSRGDHAYLTLVDPLNVLIANYEKQNRSSF